MVSATIGGRFGTVTAKRCSADSPSSSVAVTVTSVSPFASPVTTTTLPETVADTTALSVTAGTYVSESPSRVGEEGGYVHGVGLVDLDDPRGDRVDRDRGPVGDCHQEALGGRETARSVAVTATVTTPFATATMVTVAPSTAADSRLESETAAR